MAKVPNNKLKAEHKIVLRAVEIANTAHKRVADTQEIVTALSLSATDVKRLEDTYYGTLSHIASKILGQLCVRKLIFSAGKIGKSNYYGTDRSLAPENRSLPNRMTRRQRVFSLVQRTVELHKRAVRTGDILEFAANNPDADGLTVEEITHDVLSLKETGGLRVISATFRKDEKGINRYLPSNLDPNDFTTPQPLTWLEEVAHAFNELWEQKKKEAVSSGRLPRPITTGEVRAKLLASPQPHKKMQESQPIVSAMIALSQTGATIVRKIKRKGQRASLWAPCAIPDSELDIGDAYASDSERIAEAVKRATERLGSPVTLQDVKAEIKLDLALQPARSATLFEILTDLSKDRTLTNGTSRRFYRVGNIDGASYYCYSSTEVPDARFYVKFHQVRSCWLASSASEPLTEFENSSVSSILIGRAMLNHADAKTTIAHLTKLLDTGHGNLETRLEAEALLAVVQKVDQCLRAWLDTYPSERSQCPQEVASHVPTLTASELLSLFKPLYPRAGEITNPHKIISLLSKAIRRVPNSGYRHRFSQDPTTATEWLFDRTAALLYGAKKWGGRECCLQAMVASSQLGYLRDARFVFPLLQANVFEQRLIGVACLAFLQTKEAAEYLRRAVVEDSSPSMRQASLWACGFIQIESLQDLIKQAIENDPNERVREFATSGLNSDAVSWWFK